MDLSYQNDEDLQDYEDQQLGMDDISSMKNIQEINDYRPQTPPTPLVIKGLPWVPKVRQKDLQFFLDQTRIKFLGFKLDNDIDTLIGLPDPIHESVAILKQVNYLIIFMFQHLQNIMFSVYVYIISRLPNKKRRYNTKKSVNYGQ